MVMLLLLPPPPPLLLLIWLRKDGAGRVEILTAVAPRRGRHRPGVVQCEGYHGVGGQSLAPDPGVLGAGGGALKHHAVPEHRHRTQLGRVGSGHCRHEKERSQARGHHFSLGTGVFSYQACSPGESK